MVALLVAAGAMSAAITTLAPATPAIAAVGDCDGTHYANAGRELFAVAAKYIPAPLRAFPADCASRISSEPFADGTGISAAYSLVYTDATLTDLVDIVRSFETNGYGDPGGLITLIDVDPATSGDQAVQLDADGVAALDPQRLQFAIGRFSDPRGVDQLSIYYTDGVTYQVDPLLTTPSIEITLLLAGPFSATGIADPSVLSSLRTISEALPNATQTAVLGGTAVVLMLVVGFPGTLLSKVVGERYDQASGWLRKRFRRSPGAKPLATPGTADAPRRWRWLIWPGLAIAAVISGFVDPAFGVNELSGRLLVTGFVTFLIFNFAAWSLVRVVIARRQKGSKPYIKFRWGSLLILAAAVLIARALELQPGVIFGLVTGLAFGATLALSADALVVLVGSGFALAIALFAWAGYSFVAPMSAAEPGNPVLIFVTEMLSGFVIEGISTLPLALLPLGTLDGVALRKWKTWVWAVAYAVGLAAFMLVLITIPDSFGEIGGDFARWLILFGIFGVVAVGIWVLDTALRRRQLRRHPESASATG
ncbi:hypothetical protein BH09ACT4_BH09ACT4_06940 [soil metagenome]